VRAGNRDRLTIVPALRCERVDESGAGDAFTAAFAVALLERRPVRTAACLAAAAAQISMSRPGGQESYPGRTDIDARLPLLLACANGLQPA
jgi:ribokinase